MGSNNHIWCDVRYSNPNAMNSTKQFSSLSDPTGRTPTSRSRRKMCDNHVNSLAYKSASGQTLIDATSSGDKIGEQQSHTDRNHATKSRTRIGHELSARGIILQNDSLLTFPQAHCRCRYSSEPYTTPCPTAPS